MNHVDELYVDIGAKSAEEVRGAGVDVLDPIVLRRPRGPEATLVQNFRVGQSGLAGPGTGDRLGAEALLELLVRLRGAKAAGTTTVAFVTQQWLGGRGLNRLLTEIQPEEMVFLGRLVPAAPAVARTSWSVRVTSGIHGVAPSAH